MMSCVPCIGGDLSDHRKRAAAVWYTGCNVGELRDGVMGKKKRTRLPRKMKRSQSGPRRRQGKPVGEPEEARQPKTVTDHPQSSNMEELERQHAAWLARHGHAYISLAETAQLWNRTPEQIIRWEQVIDENGY